jgi:16S rRNA (guanine1516-N2)-methyltransferase
MSDPAVRIALLCADQLLTTQAAALAATLEIPLVTGDEGCDFLLVLTGDRLELRQAGTRAPGPVFVDFAAGALHYRRRFGGGRKEPLARAVGLKANRCPLVVDATAGLGRDSFILAALGCRVMMLERSPLIAALLADGLQRAARDPQLAAIAARMQVTRVDCLNIAQLDPRPDVIYLDPMYPHRTKSALVKKEMRLVRAVVGDDPDAALLLGWALRQKAPRVVVKRPQDAPALGSARPAAVIPGKNSRFDIYLPGKIV